MAAVCETKDVCPKWKDPDSGYEAPAEACTSDAMLPGGFELANGKRFSCDCRFGSLTVQIWLISHLSGVIVPLLFLDGRWVSLAIQPSCALCLVGLPAPADLG